MDVGRVFALSDGVFAIAATLLVLEIRLPDGLDHQQFLHALGDTVPALRGYLISFLVIGQLWLGHHRQFRALLVVSPRVARLNLVLLGLVALLPFPTALLSRYESEHASVALYSVNVAAIFLTQAAIAALTAHRNEVRGLTDRRARQVWLVRSAAPAAVFLLSVPAALLVEPSLVLYAWIVVFLALGQGTRLLAKPRDRVVAPAETPGDPA
ncbi:DUF1211 domain-containing protein [Solihabitans fulvus]|uniref:DUF1211 domain-containing protein n=1 Tax=Solihabitans fulvus TaxID=1892852 RepID=A0A5B2XJQ2_9PSEU|nr:DUF1211 domain-containing protein [Solihabitans fulvus]